VGYGIGATRDKTPSMIADRTTGRIPALPAKPARHPTDTESPHYARDPGQRDGSRPPQATGAPRSDERLVETFGELRVVVVEQEADVDALLLSPHPHVPRLLGHPACL